LIFSVDIFQRTKVKLLESRLQWVLRKLLADKKK